MVAARQLRLRVPVEPKTKSLAADVGRPRDGIFWKARTSTELVQPFARIGRVASGLPTGEAGRQP